MVHNIQGKIYLYPVDYEPTLKVMPDCIVKDKNTVKSHDYVNIYTNE